MKVKIPYRCVNYTLELIDIGAGKLAVKFPYNPWMKDQVKESFAKPPGNPFNMESKFWYAMDEMRTWFTIDALQNGPMIQRYDIELPELTFDRPLYTHQRMMVSHLFTRRRAVWAIHMGLGKTLACIEVMERVAETKSHIYNTEDRFWIVCPKNLFNTWKNEIKKWNCSVMPRIVSVDSLKKAMDSAPCAPQMVVLDESSKVKSHKAQRSKLALSLSNQMFKEWKGEEYFVCMSGTPSPKDARNWWMQCEIACPGFLRENTWFRFQERIAVMETAEGAYGAFKALKTFKDGNCSICENPESSHPWFDEEEMQCPIFTPKVTCSLCGMLHTWIENCGMFMAAETPINEMAGLVKRMKGLTISLKEEDCKDLPKVIYQVEECPPSDSMIRAAELVQDQESTVIGMLTKIRQVSDGFVYNEDKTFLALPESPKRDKLKIWLERLEEAEESRIIIYAAFKASIDIIQELCEATGWKTIVVDSRGWRGTAKESSELHFASNSEEKIAFIAHPGSAGMGLNLQAARYELFYSNDFNAESRIQAEARARRPDSEFDSIFVVDFVCLGTDRLVLDNLKKKKDAQSLTMSEIKRSIM